MGVAVDVSDEAEVAAMVALAVDTYGGLDILHANAADLSADTLVATPTPSTFPSTPSTGPSP